MLNAQLSMLNAQFNNRFSVNAIGRSVALSHYSAVVLNIKYNYNNFVSILLKIVYKISYFL